MLNVNLYADGDGLFRNLPEEHPEIFDDITPSNTRKSSDPFGLA